MKNLNEFLKIKQILNTFLIKNHSDETLLSIKYLYLIKEHNFFLENYTDLLRKKKYNILKYIYLLISKFIVLSIFIFYLFFKKKEKFNFENKKFNNKKNIFIISHLIDNQTTNDFDFYFGDLKKYENNFNIIRLMHSYSLKNNKNNIYNDKKGIQNIIFNYNLGLLNNISIFLKLIAKSSLFFFKSFQEQNYLYRKISIELLSLSTFINLVLFNFSKKIFKNNNFYSVLLTYEGHPFERLIYYASSFSKNSVKKIGYIHIPFSYHQNTPLISFNAKLNPDIVMLAGTNSYENIKFNFDVKKIIYGSRKHINYVINNSVDLIQNKLKINFLFLPEGIDSEVYDFFDLAYSCSLKFPNYNFILRIHPLIKEKIYFKLYKKIGKISNLFLSNSNIKEDSIKCLYSIYRGSSSVIESINYGSLPICYQNNVHLNTDPLYQLDNIIRISNKNDFFNFLSSSISNKYIKSDIINIRNYSSSVFTKINYDVLFNI